MNLNISILLLCIASLVSSVTYEKFIQTHTECDDKFNITGFIKGQCEYKIISNGISDPECGKDLSKSRICETTFGECSDLKLKDEYPWVCYLCWIQSPASTDIYQSFQSCIAKNVFEHAILLNILFIAILILILI